jgi:hypothetical protein
MGDGNDDRVDEQAILSLLKAQEEALLAADHRASPDKVSELLADDFIEFTRSGRVCDRIETIAALANERPVFVRRAFDFRMSLLGEAAALLTYRSARRSISDPKEDLSLRSSIWVRDQGRWRLRFHQGTPV